MASDNIVLNPGGGGDPVSANLITTLNGAGIATGEKAQRVKTGFGVAGTFTDVSASNPLPVVQTGSSALPTGAATSANQTSEVTSLASIDSKITAVNTGAVTVSSSVLPTGGSTSALQTTGNTSVGSIDTKTPALGQALAAASVPVVLTAAQVTAITPPSNTGFALDATLTGGTQKTKIVDTGGTNVASVSAAGAVKVDNSAVTQPVNNTQINGVTVAVGTGVMGTGVQRVAISSDNDPLIVKQATAANFNAQVAQVASVPVSGTLQSAAAATGNGTPLTVNGMASCIFTITGSFVGTITFEGTEDNTNYSSLSTVQLGTTTIGSTATGIGLFEVPVAGLQSVRARISAYTSGNITVTAHAVPVGYNPKVVNANIVSNTAANQSVNVAQMNGVATTMGSGVNGAGVQRVTIATDQAALPFNATAETSQISNAGTQLTPKFAVLTASASGVTTLVAAVAAKKLRVLALSLVANGSVNAKFQSHVTPTDKSGLYYLAANGGFVLPVNQFGWFETIAGEALDINLSGAVAVGGNIVYIEV